MGHQTPARRWTLLLLLKLDGPAHELRSPLIGQARFVQLGAGPKVIRRFKSVMLSGVMISQQHAPSFPMSCGIFNRRVLSGRGAEIIGLTVKVTKMDTAHMKRQLAFAQRWMIR